MVGVMIPRFRVIGLLAVTSDLILAAILEVLLHPAVIIDELAVYFYGWVRTLLYADITRSWLGFGV